MFSPSISEKELTQLTSTMINPNLSDLSPTNCGCIVFAKSIPSQRWFALSYFVQIVCCRLHVLLCCAYQQEHFKRSRQPNSFREHRCLFYPLLSDSRASACTAVVSLSFGCSRTCRAAYIPLFPLHFSALSDCDRLSMCSMFTFPTCVVCPAN